MSPMDDATLLGIGELARASGLTVSALRFYDKAGVFVPAVVDPSTGYRRYHPGQLHAARLVAGMRRVGMPLAEIGVVLEQLTDRESVEQILGAHLRRLEGGLTDARREVSRLTRLLEQEAGPAVAPLRVILERRKLARAIETVRHAMSNDPGFPVLAGVLLEVEEAVCRLVATDRYRLAVASLGASSIGTPPHAGAAGVLPAEALKRVHALLTEQPDGPPCDEVVLTLTPAEARITLGEQRIAVRLLDGDFPDYRRLLHASASGPDGGTPQQVSLTTLGADLAALAALEPAATRHTDDGVELALLGRQDDGSIGLFADPEPDEPGVAVNREFLLQAIDAVRDGQLELALDGPIAPLVLRSADRPGDLVMLMPVRREP